MIDELALNAAIEQTLHSVALSQNEQDIATNELIQNKAVEIVAEAVNAATVEAAKLVDDTATDDKHIAEHNSINTKIDAIVEVPGLADKLAAIQKELSEDKNGLAALVESVAETVRFSAQSLSDAQKATVRTNIDAVGASELSSAFASIKSTSALMLMFINDSRAAFKAGTDAPKFAGSYVVA
jgi:hypothetical protein